MPIWVSQNNPQEIETALIKKLLSPKGMIKPFLIVAIFALVFFAYLNKDEITDYVITDLYKSKTQ